ncbi:MAG: DUF3047 domain-containing protein, partial [Desulfobulbales bacterium]|nr:DUF3047 domain-containing protein [Desulfobulbales bacterium]
ILALLIMILAVPVIIPAENSPDLSGCEMIIDDFAQGIKPEWETRSFAGPTEYTWTREGGKGYIRATSRGTASGMYYKIEFDPQQYPYITWQWKVDNIISGGDVSQKSTDDYGARFYIVFPGFFFWQTRAINYIWANKLPLGQAVHSPYTSNNIMISVQSGSGNTGRWLSETRNIYDDYRRYFGRKPPKVGAIAIMTDTDNTGESASAGYGTIAVCSRDPRK